MSPIRKVTSGLYSFKTWEIEHFWFFFFFLRSAEKDILHPWVVCSSVSHLFQMEKDSYLFFKEGIFNITVHYLEKYCSIVQQMAYRGMFTTLKVQILKVHVWGLTIVDRRMLKMWA